MNSYDLYFTGWIFSNSYELWLYLMDKIFINTRPPTLSECVMSTWFTGRVSSETRRRRKEKKRERMYQWELLSARTLLCVTPETEPEKSRINVAPVMC